MTATPSHWITHAQRWHHIGPPLRPTPDLIARLREVVVMHLAPYGKSRRALLLGVTPELASIDWRPPFDLLAVDQSEAMIAAVWPGDSAHRRAVHGDWFDLPIEAGSIDLAMGDGCFSVLNYPAGYAKLAASLARSVRTGGLFSIRLFCRPAQSETVAGVVDAALGRRIGNFHAFKWRLAMALQGDDIARGVVLDDIWRAFDAHFPVPEALGARTGWPLPEILTIENYRNVSASYTYPTVREVVEALNADFELIGEWRGDYELAERCPQLAFRRR